MKININTLRHIISESVKKCINEGYGMGKSKGWKNILSEAYDIAMRFDNDITEMEDIVNNIIQMFNSTFGTQLTINDITNCDIDWDYKPEERDFEFKIQVPGMSVVNVVKNDKFAAEDFEGDPDDDYCWLEHSRYCDWDSILERDRLSTQKHRVGIMERMTTDTGNVVFDITISNAFSHKEPEY